MAVHTGGVPPIAHQTFDIDLLLNDGAAAITASGVGLVDGSAKVVTLGTGRFNGICYLDILSIDVASNDELYQFYLEGAVSDPAFAAGVEDLLYKPLGALEVTPSDIDTSAGLRLALPFSNYVGDRAFAYVRSRMLIGGTTPSIKYYCRLGKQVF